MNAETKIALALLAALGLGLVLIVAGLGATRFAAAVFGVVLVWSAVALLAGLFSRR